MKPYKTVLLAVSGMSPAILTETLWALSAERPAVIPDEVVVITTSRGAADLRKLLLSERSGWEDCSPWSALRRAILGAKADQDFRLQLTAPRIIELPNPRVGVKRPAEDLRSAADNAAAANFILEEVRRLTENPDVHVVASIAGGRKSMGALLYAAMSLIGRETDRVTHVLVNEPFDACRDFFFPGQPLQTLCLPGGRSLQARDARIELADIPFAPLRNLFEKELRRMPGDFQGLVVGCRKRISLLSQNKLEVVIHRDRPLVKLNGQELITSVREHLVLLLLAEKFSDPQWVKLASLEEDLNTLRRKLQAEAPQDNFGDWRHQEGLAMPLSETEDGAIRKALSSLRKKFKALGPDGAVFAAALPVAHRISLDLPPENVKVRP